MESATFKSLYALIIKSSEVNQSLSVLLLHQRQHILDQVVSCTLKGFGQLVCLLLGIFVLHPQQGQHVLAKLNEPLQKLLLTQTEKHTVSLVKRQLLVLVVLSNDFQILLQCLRIIGQVLPA